MEVMLILLDETKWMKNTAAKLVVEKDYFHFLGNAYKELYSQVSVSLDQNLNNEVARQLMEDYPLNTKSDIVLECAQEGAVSLLKKWPDMKSKLHVCFNKPLSETLRQLAWRLFLDNTKGIGKDVYCHKFLKNQTAMFQA